MTSDTPQDRLALAIIGRAIRYFDQDVAASDVDCDAPLLGPDAAAFGAMHLDSLELAELAVALEDELGMSLLDSDSFADVNSIRLLADHVRTAGDVERLNAFMRAWG